MKVLILHHHFNTPQKGGAIRSYYLAKALVDKGIETTVIATHNDKLERYENIEGINVRYLPIPYENKFGFYKRTASFFRYVLYVMKQGGVFRDYDVCYTISVPLTIGLASLWIKKRYKIPYVFEVGDLWPDAPVQLGFVKNSLLKRLLYGLEKQIYDNAKFIVALSSDIQETIAQRSPQKEIILIPNMADTEFFKPEDKDPAVEKEFNVEGKFVVSYIGALGFANGLDYLLECARASSKAGQAVHFILCGDGAMRESLQQSSRNLQLDNITFVPFQNRDGVRKILNITDAVFICYRHVRILETGSPNKYFDGLAAGKLIIINFGGWIKEEIEKEGCGLYVDPRQPTDFTKAISPYLESKTSLAQKQQAARSLAEKKYSRKMLSETFSRSILS